jgi:hypothetical protein
MLSCPSPSTHAKVGYHLQFVIPTLKPDLFSDTYVRSEARCGEVARNPLRTIVSRSLCSRPQAQTGY